MNTRQQAEQAARAALSLGGYPPLRRDSALEAMARALEDGAARVFAANAEDVAEARAAGLAPALLKRLGFDEARLADCLAGLRALRAMEDPLARVLEARLLDEGLVLKRLSCPIGLVALIFEARPDALVQMAGLAARSGNALVLKGGREALRTNRELAAILAAAGESAGFPQGWLAALESREEVSALLDLDGVVDLVIPRGSKEFVRSIMERSRIPVIGHADGVCHVYVHASADPAMARRLAVDSKAQYPAACNAAEVLLVDDGIAQRELPGLALALENAGVRLELCPSSAAILAAADPGSHDASMESAYAGPDGNDPGNWSVEYLDLVMAVRVVDGLEEAIGHINRFGSGHTDAIVASSDEAASRFLSGVDSASVFRNASTRFADGYRYGLGAEVGISTGKLHARGPMGVSGLLTSKWTLEGEGQLVADYASGARNFRHEELSLAEEARHGA